jgi:hypothetical protein
VLHQLLLFQQFRDRDLLLQVKEELVLLVSGREFLVAVELFDSFADSGDFEPIFGIIEVSLSILLAQAELLEN